MSKPDKPIFNQQGGRGKLYGPTHGATYMGTYQMPDGKMSRRMFNMEDIPCSWCFYRVTRSFMS